MTLVSRMTLWEKASQMRYDAGHSPSACAGHNWWNEALDGVGEHGHGLSPGYRHGRYLDDALIHQAAEVILTRLGPKASRVRSSGRPRHLQGVDLLGSQHQHLPRPALGSRS